MSRGVSGPYVVAIALLCFAAKSCVGTEVGNPQTPTSAEVELTWQGLTASIPAGLTLNDGTVFTEIWIVLEEVEFKSGPDCDEEAETEFVGVNVVEMVSGTQFPGYEVSLLPPQEYCKVNVHVRGLEEGELPPGAPEELEGRSILMSGVRADGVPFRLEADFKEDIELEGSFGLALGPEALVLAFALNEWFAPGELAAAEGEGGLEINSNSNAELLDRFEGRLAASSLLLRSSGEDGTLQPEDLQKPLARGNPN